MASGSGGSRPLAGRREDPVRNGFQIIQTPENLAKDRQLRKARCNFCAQTVSARAERMRAHREKCQGSQVISWLLK